jgi:predicted alpha-1,2-mannosidase
MKYTISSICFALLLLITGCSKLKTSGAHKKGIASQNLVDCVDPFIGTGGHGHTYPGATSPFGLVQLSPDTRLDGWDGCSGYHYSDSVIYGFSHTHLQGTGVSDYGDILFMPTNHRIKSAPVWKDAYKSKFSHEDEKAKPGYYQVKLQDYNMNAECTTTPHTGIHQYSLAPGDSCRLFIDMMHRDKIYYYDIETIGDTVVHGYRVSQAWATEQHCYFYAVFNKPFKNFTQLEVTYREKNAEGIETQVYEQVQVFSLQFDPTDKIMVKVGISGTDLEGAKKNVHSEAPHWNFDQYVASAQSSWTSSLSRARIEDTDPVECEKYYTALYHCYTVPNIWSDVDGRYRGMDNKIHTAQGYKRYSVFSLWDTYRAYHPLMASLEPERTRDWIRTFLGMYEERKELPVWELAANETYCMIGYHSVPVIVDAYFKGVVDFDTKLALEAMIATSNGPQEEKIAYTQLGYVPADQFSESVSKTLEYAYDDWCIAQFAKAINRNDIYNTYIQRAQNWKNVFDSKSGFMRPRRNGGFPEPFDPFQVDFNFTEANAWQYALYVPQDIPTLMRYHGGPNAFSQHLDDMFTAKTQTTGREQADITGLIGQYAHGNEPSHHAAFLYAHTGLKEDKEKMRNYVKRIMTELYTTEPDGLCGNEDCGQMSAWYVLAKNNLYSTVPGISGYQIIDERIETPPHIGHRNISVMSELPVIKDKLITPLPIILGPNSAFETSAPIHIYCSDPDASIKIASIPLDAHGDLTRRKTEYPITTVFSEGVETGMQYFAIAETDGQISSDTSSAKFFRKNNAYKVIQLATYDHQYHAGGDLALIDGLRGSNDFRIGAWQGYRDQFSMTLDLGEIHDVRKIQFSCLEDIKSWIWFPQAVHVYGSMDGQNFELIQQKSIETKTDDYTPKHDVFGLDINKKYRYIKVGAEQRFNTIPDWHLGAGGSSWIFIDEILIDLKP